MSDKIIFCGSKDYDRYHKPTGLRGAYEGDKTFVKSLPKKKYAFCGNGLMKRLSQMDIDVSVLEPHYSKKFVHIPVKTLNGGEIEFMAICDPLIDGITPEEDRKLHPGYYR